MHFLTRTFLFFAVSCIVIALQNSQTGKIKVRNVLVVSPSKDLRYRTTSVKRQPGPVRQLFGLFYEQWNDTKNTMNTLNRLVNDQFLPENTTTTTAAPDPNSNVSTKAPPFKITRSEFVRILRRNLKGIVRLYNLELQDALKQSTITQRDFRKNVTKEVSKFL